MMDWSTAATSAKQKPSGPNFKPGWQSATWSCIRRKPKSFTARTGTAKRHIRTSSGQASAGQHHVLRLQPGGQPRGAESHAVNDPGLGQPSSNTDVAGRHRPADQSALTGLDRILRTIRALGAAPVLRYVNQTLLAWARRKFKRFAAHQIRASRFLQSIAKNNAELFVHWRIGMTGTFA